MRSLVYCQEQQPLNAKNYNTFQFYFPFYFHPWLVYRMEEINDYHVICTICAKRFPAKTEENPQIFTSLALKELYLLKGLVPLTQYKVVGADRGAD